MNTNPINFNKPPIWKNPCHTGQDPGNGSQEYVSESDAVNFRKDDILGKVRDMANIALEQLSWKDSWAQEEFNKDFLTYYNEMRGAMNPPEYLPNFTETTKALGEPISEEELNSLDKSKTSQKTFEWLQRVAVGMEQLVYDQFSENEKQKENFRQTYLDLRQLLCEVQESVMTFKAKDEESIAKDIERKDMPESERKTATATDRKLRDWHILVIYINLLEYTKQAFGYLEQQKS